MSLFFIARGVEMWFEKIQRIVKFARKRYRDGQLLVIAVDGCGGAGKSTLCQALAEQMQPWRPVQILKLDDFYQPLTTLQQTQLDCAAAQNAYFDLVAYRQNLLEPLLQGFSVSFRSRHWLDGMGDDSVELHPKGVLIIDGVFSFSSAVRELVDLSVYVDTPLIIRTQRLLDRPQRCTDWVSHWQLTEAWHHQHENTLTAVDFVLRISKEPH